MQSSKEKTFLSSVADWIIDSGFNCNVCRDVKTGFDSIQIRRDSHLLLEILLVEIDFWRNNLHHKDFEIFTVSQKSLRSQGVPVVVLWQDLWLKKPLIVKSRLLSILGKSERIPARLTIVKRIDKATTHKFLNTNHLQGDVSSKYRYGLYLPVRYFRVLAADFQFDKSKDLLVAVATFSHARIFTKDDKPFRSHELIRFANVLNTTVIGGLDKLLSAFIKDFEPDDIMTYVDLEWSEGKSFERLKFEKISEKPPIDFCLDLDTNERQSIKKGCNDDNLILIRNAGSIKFVKTIKK